jgi:hypothetical protein
MLFISLQQLRCILIQLFFFIRVANDCFCSAGSAEQNVCVRLRESAVNKNLYTSCKTFLR